MGQKIILGGVTFFFAAYCGTTRTRGKRHRTLPICHPSTTRPHCPLPAPPRRFYPPDGSREDEPQRLARCPLNASLSRNGTEQLRCSAIRRITA